jgi:rhodanese-related sulfurtransferase
MLLYTAFVPAIVTAQQLPRGYAHVSTDEVEKFLGKPGVYLLDVDVPKIWKEHHLPGAIHITGPNLKRFLPADKNAILIFYCAEPRCSASESAAAEAVRLGYTRVYVMPEGIFGWVNAGKPTESSK